LIEDLLHGAIDDVKETRLKEFFKIKDWKKVVIHVDYIFRHKFFSDSNYNIHDPNSFLDAEIILEYKNFLTDYLKPKEDAMTRQVISETAVVDTTLKELNGVAPSFTYINFHTTCDYLTDLMKSLQNINLIAKDTKVSNFKKVFSGNKVENPVVWTGGVVDLVYFVKTLHNTKKKVKKINSHLQVASKCFIKPDGSLFDPQKLKWNSDKPANADKIENMIDLL
jgi:hypothetical protein